MQNTKVTEKRFRRSGPAGTSAYVPTAAREDEMKRKGKKEMKKIELDSIAIPQALDLAVEKGIQKGKQELQKKKRKKIFFSTFCRRRSTSCFCRILRGQPGVCQRPSPDRRDFSGTSG